jgi:hypothetical protein
MIIRLKRQPTELEKILSHNISDNGLITKIHRELKKTKLSKIQ